MESIRSGKRLLEQSKRVVNGQLDMCGYILVFAQSALRSGVLCPWVVIHIWGNLLVLLNNM